jgi:hypothetical protein
MGECGCGKTMLISYLTKWLGVPLLTLDIHGGTSEQDIVDIFAQAETHITGSSSGSGSSGGSGSGGSSGSDVYIFLDEVNTCAHMGVIAEAVCHRTLSGVRLPEHIKILAALNPYRMRPEPADPGAGATGLTYQQTLAAPGGGSKGAPRPRRKARQAEDPMKRLVYRVQHPIPRILQDFIFDFGCEYSYLYPYYL